MSRTIVVVAALALAGCGAKSGLDVPPPAAIDASRPIDTLPCRWTAGRSIALGEARASRLQPLAAAADLGREAFALRAGRVEGWEDPAFLVAPGDPPRVRDEVAMAPDAPAGRSYFARAGGWLEIVSGDAGCEARWRDEAFALVRTDALGAGRCGADALGRDEIAVVSAAPGAGPTRWSLGVLARTPGAVLQPRATLPTPSAIPPSAMRARDGTIFVAWTNPDTSAIDAQALLPDGSEVGARSLAELPLVEDRPAIAPDRLLGGAVVLFRSLRGWRLDRLRVAGGVLALEPVIALSAMEGRIPTDVVLATNESEALLALHGSAIAYVPLTGSDVRMIDAPPEGGAGSGRVVLAEGSSFGGQLFWAGVEGSGWQLFFRSLVCNR